MPNPLIGPNGGTPSLPDGALPLNLTTDGNFQVKTGNGVLQRLCVNVAGVTTPTASFYDGKSSVVTITIAAPGVISWPAHGLAAGSAVEFTTTSALPTGLSAGTIYFVANDTNLTANAFAVSDTKAHALAGTNQITTTGSQSGAQTGWNVSNPIATSIATSTATTQPIGIGAAFVQGLIAILGGGTPANVTVLYN